MEAWCVCVPFQSCPTLCDCKDYRFSCLAGRFFTICVTKEGLQLVKNPPVQETQEVQVQSLGWEDPLEKEMATHTSVLAWKIPWTVEPGSLGGL